MKCGFRPNFKSSEDFYGNELNNLHLSICDEECSVVDKVGIFSIGIQIMK